MKRAASRAAPYETPAKLSKRTTSASVNRNLSTLRRSATSASKPMPPPKWSSIKRKAPSFSSPPSEALPLPKWPTLVPTSKGKKGSVPTTSEEEITEISEEPSISVPGLRRMSTLQLEEEEKTSRKGSKALSKTGSSSSGISAVATLEKKGSVVTLDSSGTVTTVTRLASGSSVGETTALSTAPPSIRKELSKASAGGVPTKKLSSIRVFGVDAPEEPLASLSRSGSRASKSQSIRKEASLVPSASTAVPLPPGGLIEIAFSFDTTGSMSSCIDEVRGRVGDMIQRLQADIPGIRISVIAHGDYCDEDNYVIKWIDFGASLPELSNFVQTISATGGGDFDECYELVLARAQTELSWTPGSQRSLVMIGDATPHPYIYYADRDEKLDWSEEARKMAAMGVKIYAVQAMNRSESTKFYKTLAQITNGRHLKLDQFNNIFDIIMAVCYNEKGVEFVQAYEEEVRNREGGAGLHKDLEGLFSAFRGGKSSGSTPLPKLSKGASKVLAKGAAKGKASAAAKKTVAKGKAATVKKPKAGAASKGKATPAKGKGKATPAKGKGKATSAKGKGKAILAKGKATSAKGKAKVTKAKAKAGAKAAAKKARGKGVKAIKGRKPTKTTKKKTTKSAAKKSKKPVPGVVRKFREAVKDEELSQGSCLRKIDWEDWEKAIVARYPSPRGPYAPHFKDRDFPERGRATAVHRAGLRNLHLCRAWDKDNAPAVYEFAVKLKPTKKYVVFFKACSSWRKKVFWDTILVNTKELHQEINALVQSNTGQILMRRGIVKDKEALKEVTQHLNKYYDYAWKKRKGREGTAHRRVKKCNTLISGN